MLAANKLSVAEQTDQDWEQILITDATGMGIYAANRSLAANGHRVVGEWVYILDDDNHLVDTQFVATIRKLAKNEKCDIIVVKSVWMGGIILPRPEYWGRPPARGQIDSLNVIVRQPIWKRHIAAFGKPSCGDFHFIKELFDYEYQVCWIDRVVAAVQQIGSLTGR